MQNTKTAKQDLKDESDRNLESQGEHADSKCPILVDQGTQFDPVIIDDIKITCVVKNKMTQTIAAQEVDSHVVPPL